MNKNISIKILTIFSFICSILSILILTTNESSDGYEFSIYLSIPFIFWALFIVSNILSISALIIDIENKDNRWLFPYISIFLNHLILSLLPIVRNYFFFGGGSDSLIHFGDMLVLNSSGHFSPDNYYPILILQSSTFSKITNISLHNIPVCINIVYYTLYLVFIPVLAKLFSKTKKTHSLIIIFGTIIFWGHNFAPFSRSVFFIPLVVFCIYKLCFQNFDENKYFVLLFIISTLMVFFHPLTSLFLTIIYLGITIVRKIIYRIHRFTIPRISKIGVSLSLSSFIMLWLWFSDFNTFKMTMRETFITTAQQNPPIQTYSYLASKAELIDIVNVFMYKYISEFSILLIGLIFSIYLFFIKKFRYTYDLIFQYVVFSFLILVFLLKDLIVGMRSMPIAIIFASLIAGIGFGLIIIKKKKLYSILAIVTIIIMFFSIFSFYPSPLLKETNPQVTPMDVQGTGWTSKYREPNTTYNIKFYGRLDAVSSLACPENRVISSIPPDHFNFSEEDFVNSLLGYILVNKRFRRSYPTLYPTYENEWKFTENDFSQLETNTTYIKNYASKEFDIYTIFYQV